MRQLLFVLLLMCGLAGQVWAQEKILKTADIATLRTKAESGDAQAQYDFGLLFVEGKYFKQDFTEAFRWYLKSGLQGNAEAEFNLGVMYSSNTRGTKEDYIEALKWYQKSAEQGYTKAQVNLGDIYIQGNLVPQNFTKAVELLSAAAGKGDEKAREKLTLIDFKTHDVFQSVQNVSEEEVEHIIKIRKEAYDGEAVSQSELGEMYLEGKNLRQNFPEAAKFFKKSADQGYPEGQYFLGLLYFYGKGVSQNYEEAYFWFLSSRVNGDENNTYLNSHNAAIMLEKVSKILTPTQIADLQKRAREWKPVVTQVKQ